MFLCFPDKMPTLEELIGAEHADDIAATGSGDEKVAFLEENSGLVRQLLEMGFNGSHMYEVLHGSEWKEKFVRVSRDYKGVWKPLGFTGSHLAQIVFGAGWEEKLDRISSNYETVWKPLGFTPSHIAKIVRGKGWEQKLQWIDTRYAESGYTPAEVPRIMAKKNWVERLGYETTAVA